jgi:hypothetical protein
MVAAAMVAAMTAAMAAVTSLWIKR